MTQDQERDVVVRFVGGYLRQEPVTKVVGWQVPAVLDCATEPVEPIVDRLAASLDQPIGVHHQDIAAREIDGAFRVFDIGVADPEQWASPFDQEFDASAGSGENRWGKSGTREAVATGGVEQDRTNAGAQCVSAASGEQVRGGERLPGRRIVGDGRGDRGA